MVKNKLNHWFEIIIYAILVINYFSNHPIPNESIIILLVYLIWIIKDLVNHIKGNNEKV